MAFLDPDSINRINTKDTFLLDNPGINRVPKTGREWSRFVVELNKYIAIETGEFGPTFNGFSADPGSVPLCRWSIFGPTVFIQFSLPTAGTSNATTFEISNLPDKLTPGNAQTHWFFGAEDNGAASSEPVAAYIGEDGVIRFGLGHDNPEGGGWTASGDKGFTSEFLTISYSLWDKGMTSA